MASTRDKRLKTDSPTPVQPAEPVVITPTSKAASTAIKLKRMSRNRSGILSVKTENEDGNDSVGLSEDTQSSTASVDAANLPKTPNTRTKRQKEEVKDEKEEESGDVKEGTDDAGKDPDTPRTRKLTKAQLLKKKGAELALARRKALLKRGNLHSPVKSSSRFISGRLSGSTKAGENVKEEEKTAVKKGKPGRKPAAEKKEAEVQQATEEEAENLPETEVETEKPTEVLEKSDVTEKSAEVNDSQSLETSIKQEKNTSISAIDLQNVRRSTRARKSTIKDRDSPFTGRRSQARDKSEQKRDSISPALSSTSIKAEKENSKAISITVDQTEVTEKDVSLSPELVSEEMDTESVQNLYDKPDFLENNLGIEQDPKLGEIVKVQEKTKVVEPVIKNEDEPLPEIELKEVEEKEESKEEKVNGDKEIEKVVEDKPEVKTESNEEKVEEPVEKDEESGEENKENNESSARSVGSGSPRAEISLKIVTEENVPKIDSVESEHFKEKETHLFAFGLMTHKAAAEAKKAKIKRQEELAKIASQPPTGRKSKKDSASNEQQYTGTLKTIIKLNRTEKEKRKTRMPLKMTFQKKNRDRDSNGSSNSSDSFYTIQEVSYELLSSAFSGFNDSTFTYRRKQTRSSVTVR